MLRASASLVALLLASAALPAAAECRPEETAGSVAVESCAIDGADYRLLRAETTVHAAIFATIALLDDAEACPEWQGMCVEETAAALDRPFETLRQRVSGRGIARRVTVNRARWWRTEGGGAVGDIAGADDLVPAFKGKRVLCLRSRWFLTPTGEEGTIRVVQETVNDPQPPFGMGSGVVTPRTAKTMVETFTNLGPYAGDAKYAGAPALDSLPLLERDLPDLGAEFARCQAARR